MCFYKFHVCVREAVEQKYNKKFINVFFVKIFIKSMFVQFCKEKYKHVFSVKISLLYSYILY
jgi:hypothetical protein